MPAVAKGSRPPEASGERVGGSAEAREACGGGRRDACRVGTGTGGVPWGSAQAEAGGASKLLKGRSGSSFTLPYKGYPASTAFNSTICVCCAASACPPSGQAAIATNSLACVIAMPRLLNDWRTASPFWPMDRDRRTSRSPPNSPRASRVTARSTLAAKRATPTNAPTPSAMQTKK